jgi:hypothetical protein
MGALMAERGRDCLTVGMPPVPCPRCGSPRTELRSLPPKAGDRVERQQWARCMTRLDLTDEEREALLRVIEGP